MSETEKKSNHFENFSVVSRSHYPNTTSTGINNEEGPAKRQAMKGQWQTPPVGEFFPSAAMASTRDVSVPLGDLPVPSTSDDYARALQEAYRRGAEAAAALSQSQKMSSSIPSPMFNVTTDRSVPKPSTGISMQYLRSNNVMNSNQTFLPNTVASATPGSTNMGVPTPIPMLDAKSTPQAVSDTVGIRPSPLASATTSSQSPSVRGTSHTSQIYSQPSVTSIKVDPSSVLSENVAGIPSSTVAVPPAKQSMSMSMSSSNRSISMPDMSLLENKVEDEEAKRLKRLARNRASARLRRLRKKNLVCIIPINTTMHDMHS